MHFPGNMDPNIEFMLKTRKKDSLKCFFIRLKIIRELMFKTRQKS